MSRELPLDKWAALQHPVVVIISLTAFCGFAWVTELVLARPRDSAWCTRCNQALPALRALFSTLPLLGLLGTIVGLLDTFRQMQRLHGFDVSLLVSGGIGDAMITTQVGLLMVIPGWVALSFLSSFVARAEAAPEQAS